MTNRRLVNRSLKNLEQTIKYNYLPSDQFNSESSGRQLHLFQRKRPELLLTGDLEASLNDGQTEESDENSKIGKRSEKSEDYWKDIDISFHARVHFITNPGKRGKDKQKPKSKRDDEAKISSRCTDSSCSTNKGAVQYISDFVKKTINRITNKQAEEIQSTTVTSTTQFINRSNDFASAEFPAVRNAKYTNNLEDLNYTSLAEEIVSTTPDQYCSCDDATEASMPGEISEASSTMTPEEESKMEKLLEIVDTVKKLDNLIKESQEGPQGGKNSNVVMKLQKFSGSPKNLSNAGTRDLDAWRARIVRTLARTKSERNASKKNNDNARRKRRRKKEEKEES